MLDKQHKYILPVKVINKDLSKNDKEKKRGCFL